MAGSNIALADVGAPRDVDLGVEGISILVRVCCLDLCPIIYFISFTYFLKNTS